METVYLTRVPLRKPSVVLLTQGMELAKEGYVHMVAHSADNTAWLATHPAPRDNMDAKQWSILSLMSYGELYQNDIDALPNWLVVDIDANTLTNTALGLQYHYVPIDSIV